MTKRTWIIVGATSIIAEEFARLVAKEGHDLRLLGRNIEQLKVIADDLKIRFAIGVEVFPLDVMENNLPLEKLLYAKTEVDLFLAQSDFAGNAYLNEESIKQLIQINITASVLLINAYWQKPQSAHHLLYLSSVAACRGRTKNSLYGASKAAIEVYLQGLQQSATPTQIVTIARLGFIDTKQTYGLPGIFYAAPPKDCAQACLQALKHKKRMFYFPGFWRLIMGIITRLPFFVYKRMEV
ncbi:MAG: SDR family NAD(P)-dependent oxidoreductase [Legionella sp.]|nr:MAG: SDR family NAD(P)-dependent oxidoreductase [Legionella sp.]